MLQPGVHTSELWTRRQFPCIHSLHLVDNDGYVKLASVTILSVLGLSIGSFLNVVIDRVPKRESIVRPRSRCPRCEQPIASRDNIPVLSWLLLRGKCRSCGLPISIQYPAVELGTAILFGAVAARFGPGWNLAIYVVLFAGLIPLMVVDLLQHLLPVRILYPVLLVDAALILADSFANGRWHALLVAVCSSAAWFALFFATNLVRPDALGFGDVRLAALVGLSLGWLGVVTVFVGFFASNFFGLIVGGFLIATGRATRKTKIPLGVFIGLGAILAVFIGPALSTHFRGIS